MNESPILYRYRDIVDDFASFEEASRMPLGKVFRINGMRARHDDIVREWISPLRDELRSISWLPDAFRISGSGFQSLSFAMGYIGGLFHIQEEASMLPVQFLDTQPGETVLDLCAAPGNKTVQLANAVGSKGTVLANDVSSHRLGVLRTTIDRLGLSNVVSTVADAATFASGYDLFDRVLADVPCSCEGTSRKNPQVLSRENTSYRRRLPALQSSILERALELCKPGGRVVYATCTYAPEECEGVVSQVMEHTQVGRLCSLIGPPATGLRLRPGLKDWCGQTFHSDMDLTVRMWPHDNDTGGFFCAIIEKQKPSEIDRCDLPRERLTDSTASLELPVLLQDEAERFGIADTVLSTHRVSSVSTKHAWVVSRYCNPPSGLSISGEGVRAINRKGNRNRLSTAGIMLFGAGAGKQAIELNDSQLRAFLTRRTVDVSQLADIPNGQCLITAKGLVFGRGEVSSAIEPDRLQSFFPHTWAGMDVRSRLG